MEKKKFNEMFNVGRVDFLGALPLLVHICIDKQLIVELVLHDPFPMAL